MNLLTARKGTGFDRFDALVLAAYIAVLAFAIHHYLPFSDEAQAWLIARDSSLHEMLFRRLHYEGGPALWPLILWVAIRLHMPYSGINWMAGAFALPGIYLLLRFSPFPRIFRWLMPFTFFLQYQYAVVARPYVFVAVLLFTMCILFTLARPQPVLFALAAGLLANISLHAAIVAGIFCLLYLYELYRPQRESPVAAPARSVLAGAGLFLLLALCSAAAAFPAPDAAIAFTPSKTVMKPRPLLRKLIPEERLPPSAPPLDRPLDSNGEPAKPPPAISPIIRSAVFAVVIGGSAACYPIATSNLLAIGFLTSFWLWLWSRGSLRLLSPFLISVLLSVQIFVLAHHTGIFLLTLVAAAWIALDIPVDRRFAGTHSAWIQPVFTVIALVVVVLQIGWSYHCIHSEVYMPPDPGRETEAFLAQNFSGKRIAGFGFESVSTQAYAPHSLFFNQPHAYWVWSVNVSTDRRRSETLRQHPDVVVADDFFTREDSIFNQWHPFIPAGLRTYVQMIQFWQHNGYRETHRFCGDRFIRLGVEDTFCEVILEPGPSTNAPMPQPVR